MHILPLASIVGQELPATCMLCPHTIIFWEMAIAYGGSSAGPSSPDQTSVTAISHQKPLYRGWIKLRIPNLPEVRASISF